jgi:hypothetical protein
LPSGAFANVLKRRIGGQPIVIVGIAVDATRRDARARPSVVVPEPEAPRR